MIKHIQQVEAHKYSIIGEFENEVDGYLNLITGKHLMEVYFHVVPVFRCNMGAQLEDDMLLSRISHKGMTAYIQQSWLSCSKHCYGFPVPETFASHAMVNFCDIFKLDYHSIEKEMREGRRDKDAIHTKNGVTE